MAKRSRRYRLLVLAGTREAREYCHMVSAIPELNTFASFLNTPVKPSDYPVPVRSGGFGGVEGLVRFVEDRKIDIMADVTHPFARQISINAWKASEISHIHLIRMARPEWDPVEISDAIQVKDVAEFCRILPPNLTVFMPLGSSMFREENVRHIASRPDTRFVLRALETPKIQLPENVTRVVDSHPPYPLGSERILLKSLNIDCILCRNSGGMEGLTKLHAARELELAIYLLKRPRLPPVKHIFSTVAEAKEFTWHLVSPLLKA